MSVNDIYRLQFKELFRNTNNELDITQLNKLPKNLLQLFVDNYNTIYNKSYTLDNFLEYMIDTYSQKVKITQCYSRTNTFLCNAELMSHVDKCARVMSKHRYSIKKVANTQHYSVALDNDITRVNITKLANYLDFSVYGKSTRNTENGIVTQNMTKLHLLKHINPMFVMNRKTNKLCVADTTGHSVTIDDTSEIESNSALLNSEWLFFVMREIFLNMTSEERCNAYNFFTSPDFGLYYNKTKYESFFEAPNSNIIFCFKDIVTVSRTPLTTNEYKLIGVLKGNVDLHLYLNLKYLVDNNIDAVDGGISILKTLNIIFLYVSFLYSRKTSDMTRISYKMGKSLDTYIFDKVLNNFLIGTAQIENLQPYELAKIQGAHYHYQDKGQINYKWWE